MSTVLIPETHRLTAENSSTVSSGWSLPTATSSSMPVPAAPNSRKEVRTSSLPGRLLSFWINHSPARFTSGRMAVRKIDSAASIWNVSVISCGTQVMMPSLSSPMNRMIASSRGRPETKYNARKLSVALTVFFVSTFSGVW